MHIEFVTDKSVSYDTFVNDVAMRVVQILKQANDDPDFISQRKAYKMFGRGNVDRWRRTLKVKCYTRPGKVEYRTADLRQMQYCEQDYLYQ